MWVVVIFGIALLAFGAVWSGFAPPQQAKILIKIQAGQVQITKGRLPAFAKEHVTEVVAEYDLAQGWIAVLANSRVVCSRGIPVVLQQRLRNVLVNRGAK